MRSIRRTVICLVTLVLLLLGALSAVAQSPENTVFLPLTQRQVLPPPAPSGPPSEKIDITFIEPEENQPSETELEVIVSISSPHQIERVTAQVGDRFVDLAYSEEAYRPPNGLAWQPGWTGVLDLSGVERGSQQVVVTVTDVFDNWARAERTFVLDSPPALTVTAPANHTVARPEVHLEARCTDDAPEGCTGLEVRAAGVYETGTVTVAETTGNYLTETVSLEDVDANLVRLQFIAYDAADQPTVAERFVYLDPSSHLVEIDSAPGIIWDVQPDRFLHLNTERSPVDLKILDRSTGESEHAMSAPASAFCDIDVEYLDCQQSRGFLSPRGAIFVAQDENATWQLYDWADGQLELVMDEIYDADLSVVGDYAVWAHRDTGGQRTLYQRDLQQGTHKVVGTHVTEDDFKVTDQGEILFTAAESEDSSRVALFLYQDGVTTQLTEPAGSEYEIPFTLDFDGEQILYQTVFTPTQTYKLKLRELTGEETTIAESEGGFDHSQLNNGWVAFNRTDSSNNKQIWTRSPGGTLQQATPFNESSHLEALGPNGEVVVTVLGSRYVAIPPYDSPPVRISTFAGYPFWQGNELFVVIGRTLFGVDY